MKFDIFISYKRKSLATANNLYYRLTTRGYSTFFDLEEMRSNDFNKQILTYIEGSNDVFVILEEGSLDACKNKNWENDWFCREIIYALEKHKNIIPILIGGYRMPSEDELPDKLKELTKKHAPEFSFVFFEEYLNRLIEKGDITSRSKLNNQSVSVFKFYSNKDCKVYQDGRLVCSLVGESNNPFYLPIDRKGEFVFKCVRDSNQQTQTRIETIDTNEEKIVIITWNQKKRVLLKRLAIVCILLIVSVLFILVQNSKHTDETIAEEENTEFNHYSNSQYSYEELIGYDKKQLRLLRNEIYAKHGYIFHDKELQSFFEKQRWYQPVTTDVEEIKLSETEQSNILLIKRVESMK